MLINCWTQVPDFTGQGKNKDSLLITEYLQTILLFPILYILLHAKEYGSNGQENTKVIRHGSDDRSMSIVPKISSIVKAREKPTHISRLPALI